MKVFKLNKYHICYREDCPFALCSKMQRVFRVGLKFDYYDNEDYNEGMDICKTCQRMNFDRIVRKLKGK